MLAKLEDECISNNTRRRLRYRWHYIGSTMYVAYLCQIHKFVFLTLNKNVQVQVILRLSLHILTLFIQVFRYNQFILYRIIGLP